VKTALSDALALISSHLTPLRGLDSVPLMKAGGRICAEAIVAKRSIPPFDISLRDGQFIPIEHKGAVSLHVKELPFIATGERVAENCALIIESEMLTGETYTLPSCDTLPSKEHIKCKGEDIKQGECLVAAGAKIGPFDITNLASQGIANVSVIK